MRGAIERLRSLGSVSAVASLYETSPVGGPEQDNYLNSAVILETDLDPQHLLVSLLEIEAALGRVRNERWGPRTLDLDIIAYAGPPLDTDSLTIPHPRAHERRFVVEPLAEIWPRAPLGQDLDTLLQNLAGQDVSMLRRHWLGRSSAGTWLVAGQMAILGLFGVVIAVTGTVPADLRLGTVIGLVLAVFGLVMMMGGALALGPGLTAHPEPVREGELREDGVFRLVRHPIYGGIALLLFGCSMLLTTIPGGAVATLMTVYFWFKAGHEERLLRAAYPGYADYSRRVSRRLIPFLV